MSAADAFVSLYLARVQLHVRLSLVDSCASKRLSSGPNSALFSSLLTVFSALSGGLGLLEDSNHSVSRNLGRSSADNLVGGHIVEVDLDLGDVTGLGLEEPSRGGERSHGGLAQLSEASRQHLCVV